MQTWDLTTIPAPDGTRDPYVLDTADGARAVMLKLDAGQELREHEVKERAWVTVVEGSATIECDGKQVEGRPGTLVSFAPGERHAIATENGARILLFLAPWPGEGHFQPGEAAASASS
jgi:quercetin dioxygenase-like cupin family protein